MNLVVTILSLTLIVVPCQPGSVDLSFWLSSFSECNVNVKSLEPNLWLEPVSFPISLSTFQYHYKLFNFDYDHIEFGSGTAKWIFCSVQVFLMNDRDILKNASAFGPGARDRIFPNPFCSIRRRWTNCLTFIVGLTRGDWDNFLRQKPSFWSQLTSFEVSEGLLSNQFLLIGNTTDKNGLGTCDYVCRTCHTQVKNGSRLLNSVLIPVELRWNEDVVPGIERTVNDVRDGGRSLGFPISSYLRPKAPAQFPPTHLSRISQRDYYARHRIQDFTYIEVVEAILLHETPPVVDPPFPRNEIFSRTVTMDTSTVLCSKRLHLSFSDSFNFITCHGLENKASIAFFFVPFDLFTWVTLLSVFLLLVSLLMASLCLLGSKTSPNDPFQRLSALWFFTLAALVENNYGHQNPVPSQRVINTTRIIFLILAYVCIVLGCLYRGILTRDIIAPLPNIIPYEHMADLSDFNLLVLPIQVILNGEESLPEILPKARTSEEQDAGDWWGQGYIPFFSNLGRELGTIFPFKTELSLEYLHRLRLVSSLDEMASELKVCDQKRALVGLQAELAQFFKAEARTTSQMGVGKDAFLPFFYYWQIPMAAGGYLDRRMSAIISSGLVNLWEGVWKRSKRQRSYVLNGTDFSGNEALRTNLASLFKLLIFAYSFGLIVFFAELVSALGSRIWYRIWNRIRGLRSEK